MKYSLLAIPGQYPLCLKSLHHLQEIVLLILAVCGLSPTDQFKYQKTDPFKYAPLQHRAVLLKYTKHKIYTGNKRFYDYLLSADVKAVFSQYDHLSWFSTTTIIVSHHLQQTAGFADRRLKIE